MMFATRYIHNRRNRLVTVNAIYVLVALLLSVLITVSLLLHFHNKSLLPESTAKKISFVVYFPPSDWQVPSKSITYDNKAGVLSLETIHDGDSLTLKEQAVPSQFDDIPQYYPTLIRNLNRYDTVGSANGTVYLTRPSELSGQTVAVLNNNGTLLFATAQNHVDLTSWRQFFNNLQLQK